MKLFSTVNHSHVIWLRGEAAFLCYIAPTDTDAHHLAGGHRDGESLLLSAHTGQHCAVDENSGREARRPLAALPCSFLPAIHCCLVEACGGLVERLSCLWSRDAALLATCVHT